MAAAVTVAIRLRPLLERELPDHNSECTVEILPNQVISVEDQSQLNHGIFNKKFHSRHFTFDNCLEATSSQEHVFETIGSDVLETFQNENRNTAVIAYGQTGSGKTHTMLGDTDNRGLIPRICENLIETPQEYVVSFYEIHNEKVFDLLAPNKNCLNSPASLRVRQHPKQGPYVEGLSYRTLHCSADIEMVLKTGCEARSTAATSVHHYSSRSHAVFTVQSACLTGNRLSLVDLAGSEKPQASASKDEIKETAHINRSLATLGNVVLALSTKSKLGLSANASKFVPYRDSKLTWLLRDSLGGSARAFMIGTISPSSTCISETLKTLRFANRARNIFSLNALPDQGFHDNVAQPLIAALQAEISRLRQMLSAAENPSLKLVCECAQTNGSQPSVTRAIVSRSSMTSPQPTGHMYRSLCTLEEIQQLQQQRLQSVQELASLSEGQPSTALEAKIEDIERRLVSLAQDYPAPPATQSDEIGVQAPLERSETEFNDTWTTSANQQTHVMEVQTTAPPELDANPFKIESDSNSSVWSITDEAPPPPNDNLDANDEFSKSGSFITFDAVPDPDPAASGEWRLTQSYAGDSYFDRSTDSTRRARNLLDLNKSLPETQLRKRRLKLNFESQLANRLYPKKLADESRPKFAFLRRTAGQMTEPTPEPMDPVIERKREAFRAKFESLNSSQTTICSVRASINEDISSAHVTKALRQEVRERAEKRLRNISSSSSESSGTSSALSSPGIKLPSIASLDLSMSNERRASLTATMDELSKAKLLKLESRGSLADVEDESFDSDPDSKVARRDSSFLASSLLSEAFADDQEEIPEEIEDDERANDKAKEQSADGSDLEVTTVTVVTELIKEEDTFSVTTIMSQLNPDHSPSKQAQLIGSSTHTHLEEDTISITTITSNTGDQSDSPSKEAKLISNTVDSTDLIDFDSSKDVMSALNDLESQFVIEKDSPSSSRSSKSTSSSTSSTSTSPTTTSRDWSTPSPEQLDTEPVYTTKHVEPLGPDTIRQLFPDINGNIPEEEEEEDGSPSGERRGSLVETYAEQVTTTIQDNVITELTVRMSPETEAGGAKFEVHTSHVPVKSAQNDAQDSSAMRDLYGMLVSCEQDLPSTTDEDVLQVSMVDGVPYITMQPKSQTDALEKEARGRLEGASRAPMQKALSLPIMPRENLDFNPSQLGMLSDLNFLNPHELRRSSSLESDDYADIDDLMGSSDSRKGVSWADFSGKTLEAGPSMPLKNESPLRPIIKHSPTNTPSNSASEQIFIEMQPISAPVTSDTRSTKDTWAQTELNYNNQIVAVSDSFSQYDIPSPSSTASLGSVRKYSVRRLFHDLRMVVSERDRVVSSLSHITPLDYNEVPSYSERSRKCQSNFHEKLVKSRMELSLRISELWFQLNETSLEGLSEQETEWISGVSNPAQLTLGLPHRAKTLSFKPQSPRPLFGASFLAVDYRKKLAQLRRALIGTYRDLTVGSNNDSLTAMSSSTGSSGYYSDATRREMTASWVANNSHYTGPSPEKLLHECEEIRKQIETAAQ